MCQNIRDGGSKFYALQLMSAQFPLSADFFERLKEMEKALRIMQMRAAELEKSFENLLNAGLGHVDATLMPNESPSPQLGGNESLNENAKDGLYAFKEKVPEEELPKEMVPKEGGRSPQEKVQKVEVRTPPMLTTFSKSRVLKTKFLLNLGYVEGYIIID